MQILNQEKCGCGRPVRYMVPPTGTWACNKYFRCPDAGTKRVSVQEVLNDPEHPAHQEVKQLIDDLLTGKVSLS